MQKDTGRMLPNYMAFNGMAAVGLQAKDWWVPIF
jgi:hypothetical protein